MSNRQPQNKAKLIKELAKVPIVEVACQRVGIARATYYRWLKDDDDFRISAEQALEQGCNLINDMAESKLINQIKDDKFSAITFWLRHNNPKYHSPALQTINNKTKPHEGHSNTQTPGAMITFVKNPKPED